MVAELHFPGGQGSIWSRAGYEISPGNSRCSEILAIVQISLVGDFRLPTCSVLSAARVGFPMPAAQHGVAFAVGCHRCSIVQ